MEAQLNRQTKKALIHDNDTTSGLRRTFATPGIEASAAVLTEQLRHAFQTFIETAYFSTTSYTGPEIT
jgi:hypothetical protein